MPQPVDMQTELARVTATERIQQIADRASLAAQQRLAVETDEERQAVETQVQDTPESEGAEVQADGRRRTPFVGKRGKRKDNKKSAKPYKALLGDDDEGHRLDVTI